MSTPEAGIELVAMDLASLSQAVTPESELEPEEQPINYFPDDDDSAPTNSDD